MLLEYKNVISPQHCRPYYVYQCCVHDVMYPRDLHATVTVALIHTPLLVLGPYVYIGTDSGMSATLYIFIVLRTYISWGLGRRDLGPTDSPPPILV